MTRSEAAKKGWVTRRRRAARLAGAPVITGRVSTHGATFHNPTKCTTCGRDWFKDELTAHFIANNTFLEASERRRALINERPRRCSTNLVSDFNGECLACGAANGETCLKPTS